MIERLRPALSPIATDGPCRGSQASRWGRAGESSNDVDTAVEQDQHAINPPTNLPKVMRTRICGQSFAIAFGGRLMSNTKPL
jgi:hypothetical protein